MLAITAPEAISHLPPWRSITGPINDTMTAQTRISPVRTSEKAPRDTPNSSVTGLRKMLKVLEREKTDATFERTPTPTMYQP